jgi:hypothetical protein
MEDATLGFYGPAAASNCERDEPESCLCPRRLLQRLVRHAPLAR